MNQKERYKDNEEKKKDGIRVIRTDEVRGAEIAAGMLYEYADSDTVLFLSGGKTPERLYTRLAREGRLRAGCAALVDERYGEPGHAFSNERMLERTGLPEYFKKAGIPFYRILEPGKDIRETASGYEEKVKGLITGFARSAAILGIGEDGHTAGIAPDRIDFRNPLFSPEQKERVVSYFKDTRPLRPPGTPMEEQGYGERITMTIKGLSQIDRLIVLVFGESKQDALEKVFREGSIEEAPARFLKSREMEGRTVIITDRDI